MTAKHQITIPTAALQEAGLHPGDRLLARVDGPGRIVFERETDVIAELAGSLTGFYEEGYLDKLRDEWER